MTTGPCPHRPPLAHGMCAKCMVTENPEPGQGPPSPLPSATMNHTLETSATDSQAQVKAAGYLPEEARGRRGGLAHEIYVQMSTMEENNMETGKDVRHRRPSSREGGKGYQQCRVLGPGLSGGRPNAMFSRSLQAASLWRRRDCTACMAGRWCLPFQQTGVSGL